MFVRRWLQNVRVPIALAMLLGVLCTGQPAFAQSFGTSTYGSCSYGADCAGSSSGSTGAAAPDTTFQLPSGLLIAVNLHNGQVVPESGYTIVVTPLNGQGSSFKTVSFAVNGATVHTEVPSADGTAEWLWVPRDNPGTRVTIQATGQNGQSANKSYSIELTSAITYNGLPAPGTGTTAPVPRTAVGRFIAKLPRPIVYSFPYFFFGLLALTVLVAVVQTSREVADIEVMQTDLMRLRQVADAKRDFISLASHYLRTPITLLEGGFELLPADTRGHDRLGKLIDQVHKHSEALIKSYEDDTSINTTELAGVHLYKSIRFWLPVALAGVVGFCFDYLAESSGALTISHLDLYTQIVMFVLIASVSYVALRWRQLKRRETDEVRRVITAETALMDRRESFVDDSVTLLSTDARGIVGIARTLTASQAVEFLQDGAERLEAIMERCRTAVMLKGSHSDKPVQKVAMQTLLQDAASHATDKTSKRSSATVAVSGICSCLCPEPELLERAVTTVLDNALTYAPANTTVGLIASREGGKAVVHVTDRGPGIPKEKQALLFNPFSKSEGVETFNHEGAGLSLYLDKLIMLYLGGSIAIESKPKVGTIVQLTLPG